MMVLLLLPFFYRSFTVLLLLLYNFPLCHATKKSRRAKSRREGGQLMGIIQTRGRRILPQHFLMLNRAFLKAYFAHSFQICFVFHAKGVNRGSPY